MTNIFKGIAIIAVKQDKDIYQHIDKNLKNDTDIALAAITQDSKFFADIGESLRCNEDFLLNAIKANPACIFCFYSPLFLHFITKEYYSEIIRHTQFKSSENKAKNAFPRSKLIKKDISKLYTDKHNKGNRDLMLCFSDINFKFSDCKKKDKEKVCYSKQYNLQ